MLARPSDATVACASALGRAARSQPVNVAPGSVTAIGIRLAPLLQPTSSTLQFATPDTFGLQAAFDPLMPAAVPFTVLIAPNGDIVFQKLGELDILTLRRAILANLPDDTDHPGQQAYWSGH